MTTPAWFEQKKDQVVTLTTDAAKLYQRGLDLQLDELTPPLLQGMNEGLDRLRTGRFQVAFVGQMKAGKSTLVNAMLFGRQVLPAGSNPVTAKLSRVLHAAEPAAVVSFLTAKEWEDLQRRAQEEEKSLTEGILGPVVGTLTGSKKSDPAENEKRDWTYRRLVDQTKASVGSELPGLLGTSRTIDLGDLNRYVAAPDYNLPEQGRYLGVTREVEVRFPHRFPPTVEFVDTPGTNDPDEEREKVTLDYLARADAIVLVLYAGQLATRADLIFLKQKLLRAGAHKVLLAINQIDSETEATAKANLAEYARKKIADSLLNPKLGGESVPEEFRRIVETGQVFPVSGMQALLGRSQAQVPEGDYYWRETCQLKGISSYEDAIKVSGIVPFEEYLLRYLVEDKGRQLLQAPVVRALAALRALERQGKLHSERLDQDIANLDKDAGVLQGEVSDLERTLGEVKQALEGLKGLIARETRAAIDRGSKAAQARLRDVEREMNETYVPRIDRFGRMGIPAGVENLNLDLAWRVRGAQYELEQALIDAVQGLASQLKLRLMEEIERRAEYPAFAVLRERIDEITHVNVVFAMPQLGALREAERGVGRAIIDMWDPTERKNRLKRQLSEKVLALSDGSRAAIIEAADAVLEDVQASTGLILDEVSAGLERQLEDKRRAYDARRQGSTELDRRRAPLRERKQAIEQLLGETAGQLANVTAVATELGMKSE